MSSYMLMCIDVFRFFPLVLTLVSYQNLLFRVLCRQGVISFLLNNDRWVRRIQVRQTSGMYGNLRPKGAKTSSGFRPNPSSLHHRRQRISFFSVATRTSKFCQFRAGGRCDILHGFPIKNRGSQSIHRFPIENRKIPNDLDFYFKSKENARTSSKKRFC